MSRFKFSFPVSPGRFLRRALALAALGVCTLGAPAAAEDTAQAVLAEWRHALELMQAQRPRAALPILQRLDALVPNTPQILTELGIASARAERDDAARAYLDRAQAVARNDEQRTVIRRLRAAVDAKSPFSGSISFGLVPETNVTRRSSIDTVTLGGLKFSLNETMESGTGLSFDGMASYAPMIAPDLRARNTVRFDGRVFQNREHNDYSLRVTTGLERLGDRDRVLGFGVMATQRWAGDSRFSRDQGVYGDFQALATDDTLVTGRVEWVQRRVPGMPGREGTVQRVSFGVTHAVNTQTRVSGRVFGFRTRAQAGFESGRIAGVSFGMRRAFDSGWQANANLTLSHERRDAPDPLFGTLRTDRYQRAVVAVTNRNYQYRGFSPQLEVGTERRRSNIGIHSFQNNFLGLSVTRGF